MPDMTEPNLHSSAFVMIDVEPANGAASTHHVDMRGLAGGIDMAGLKLFGEHSEGLLPTLFAMAPADPRDGPLVDLLYRAALDTARDHKARGISFTDGQGARVELRVIYMEPVVGSAPTTSAA